MFLNDQETATDLLYYESISKTVARLIRETPTAPVTIGVHGDWGAGKSSVLKMLEDAFEKNDRILCIWFNGWTFEGFEDAKTVVIETIVDELRRKRPDSKKVLDAARKVLKRVDWLKAAKKAGGLAFTAATGLPTIEQAKSILSAANSLISNPKKLLEGVKSVAEEATDLIKDTPDEADNLPEHIHAFRAEFKELIDAAEIEQLVVIVDDLDRCLPKTAIATLEAIRLFLFVERTAFVIGADESMIEYAVRDHFPDLPPSVGSISYARNYLEKLIQVPFRIPTLGLAETRAYITLLLAENALGSDHEKFALLLSAAREDLRRPWKSTGLDRTTASAALGELPPEVEQALTISAHVAKLLSEATRGNPRQIKRFLNSMMLRHAIAEERGFDADIQRPVLAKIMLAERFNPDFYEQIARMAASSPDGKPPAIEQFERNVRSQSDKQEHGAKPKSKGAEKSSPIKSIDLAPEAEEWMSNDWALRWAAIDPPLANVDLRPYVFVTRDKRMSLGATIVASRFESLVEKLMGPPIMVSAASAEIEKLTSQESQELFEIVRGRILQEDDFRTKPGGVDGLVLLVEKHPELQRKVVEFIRELPVPKLGPWVASSWSTCLSDSNLAADFETLARGWETQSENTVLQSAVRAMRKVQSPTRVVNQVGRA